MKRLLNRIHAITADAYIMTNYTGFYDDGQQHCIEYPCLSITCDTWNQYNRIFDLLRRSRNFRILYSNTTNKYFRVVSNDDFIRIKQQEAKAEMFLNAFWQYIHDNPQQDSRTQQNNAIDAGRKAIANLSY